MANNFKRNPNNPASTLFKKLTRLLSGPLVNYRRQSERNVRRRNLKKYDFMSVHGQSFKRTDYDPFQHLRTDIMMKQNRAVRYSEFEQMEFDPILNCITGDTRVATLKGFKEIEKLCEIYPNGEPFEVWCWDKDECQYTIGIAHHPRKTGTKEVLEIHIDNDKILKCTPEHKIMLIDGTYKEAQYLEKGDSLMPFEYKLDTCGYFNVRTKNKGAYKQAHRYIFENVFNKDIQKGNSIHHINCIKMDNTTNNLIEVSSLEHMKIHGISEITNKKRKDTLKRKWEEYTDIEKEIILGGVREWQSSEEGKIFMSEHTSNLNKKRWAEDINYRNKMTKVLTDCVNNLWQRPGWREWKRKYHSEVMRLKHENDPSLRDRTKHVGETNGRYVKDISNQEILLEGMKYNTLTDLAKHFDFKGRVFKKNIYKCQFIMRRLNVCGYKTWQEYKENFKYSNHKVVDIVYNGEIRNVYDLTVDIHENFCLENQLVISNSALDIYSDEITTSSDLQPLLKIACPNQEIQTELDILYNTILNIDFNLFGWARSLCKYGDLFLYLDIDEKIGVKNVIPLPVAEMERLEGEDKMNPNYTQFHWNAGGLTFENWQIAHFRILGNDKYQPYGSSVLDASRRIWRQITLLEDYIMAYRITRSSERLAFYFDVGSIPPQEVEQYMQKMITSMKRNQVVDPDTGKVDLRFNPVSVTENYYIPVRGNTQTRIEPIPGGQFNGDMDDIKYLKDKLFSAIKIPQEYLFRGEGADSDKTSLSAKDLRFARTIQRIQRSIISELEKIGIVHLYTLGYRKNDLVSFKLSLNNPSKIAELQELEAWRTKFDVASAATEGFFSRRWIGKKLFGLSDEEMVRNQKEMYFDRYFDAQLDEIVEGPSVGGGAGGSGESPLDDLGGGGDSGSGSDSESGGEESTLLASPDASPSDSSSPEPGKRDEPYLTHGAKGKLYYPVLSDKRDMGARKRSYRSKYNDESGRNTARNIHKGYSGLATFAKGIYENKENVEEDNKTIYNEETNILRTNHEINILIEDLEKVGDVKRKVLTEKEEKKLLQLVNIEEEKKNVK